MSNDAEPTPEEEEQLIEYLAQKIHQYGMETPAIFFLESSKPLAWVGGEMGRAFITPFIPIISEEWGAKSEKFFIIFEKRANIEKLLKRVEELANEMDEKKPGDLTGKKPSEEAPKTEEPTKSELESEPLKKERSRLRRFLGW